MAALTGAFLVNKQDALCFVQVGVPVKLASIRIVPGPCIIATLPDGSDEMFTDQLDAKILAAMMGKNTILIAHIGDDRKFLDEYFVPLEIHL